MFTGTVPCTSDETRAHIALAHEKQRWACRAQCVLQSVFLALMCGKPSDSAVVTISFDVCTGNQLIMTAIFTVLVVELYAYGLPCSPVPKSSVSAWQCPLMRSTYTVTHLYTVCLLLGSTVSFNYFRDFFTSDGQEYTCDTMYECFFFFLRNALPGGGISGSIEAPSFATDRSTWYEQQRP